MVYIIYIYKWVTIQDSTVLVVIGFDATSTTSVLGLSQILYEAHVCIAGCNSCAACSSCASCGSCVISAI